MIAEGSVPYCGMTQTAAVHAEGARIDREAAFRSWSKWGCHMGRPATPIDGELVRKLAKLGCTQEDIAEFFDCSHSVISERFRQDFHLGRAQSRISIRRAQMKRAMTGSDAMLIHLGRSVLGQTYKVDVTTKGTASVVYFERANNPRDADRELDGWAEQRVKAMAYQRERESKIVVELPFKDLEPGHNGHALEGPVIEPKNGERRTGSETN